MYKIKCLSSTKNRRTCRVQPQFLFSFISAGDIYSYKFVSEIVSVCHDRTSEPTASEIKIHINLSFERNTIA